MNVFENIDIVKIDNNNTFSFGIYEQASSYFLIKFTVPKKCEGSLTTFGITQRGWRTE
jgi:hypothetical protein